MALAGFSSRALAGPGASASPPEVATGATRLEESKPPPSPRETEGRQELERASRYLAAAEKTDDEDERQRNYELSVQHAERAVALLPDDPDAHFVLFGSKGRIAQNGGLASAAMALSSLNDELDQVLRLDPDHTDALAARGGMLMKLPRLLGGDTTEGLHYLERATELNPDGAGTRLELAEAYEIVGRDADALRAAREAIAIAERKGESAKAHRAREFVRDLEASCGGCAMAAGE